MKLKCLNCKEIFYGTISKDELGWHSSCPFCETTFDVDLPEGRIVMAFAEDETDEYFTDSLKNGNAIRIYRTYETPEQFVKEWLKMSEDPEGMWYWVLDNGELVVSGACDPYDLDVFKELWESELQSLFKDENPEKVACDFYDWLIDFEYRNEKERKEDIEEMIQDFRIMKTYVPRMFNLLRDISQ